MVLRLLRLGSGRAPYARALAGPRADLRRGLGDGPLVPLHSQGQARSVDLSLRPRCRGTAASFTFPGTMAVGARVIHAAVRSASRGAVFVSGGPCSSSGGMTQPDRRFVCSAGPPAVFVAGRVRQPELRARAPGASSRPCSRASSSFWPGDRLPPPGQLVSPAGHGPTGLGAFSTSTRRWREFGPWITGMVVAGIGGTAVTADLGRAQGARRDRSARVASAVDPIKGRWWRRGFLAPRRLSPAAMTMVGIFMGIVSGAVGTPACWGSPLASYTSTFGSQLHGLRPWAARC